MPRETGGDGVGKDKSRVRKANEAMNRAMRDWHSLDFSLPFESESQSEFEAVETAEAIEKVSGDFMASLVNRDGKTYPRWFSFEEFFNDHLTGDEELKSKKRLELTKVIHGLEAIALKADEMARQISQLPFWQERQERLSAVAEQSNTMGIEDPSYAEKHEELCMIKDRLDNLKIRFEMVELRLKVMKEILGALKMLQE